MNAGFVAERTEAALVIRFDRPEIRSPLSVYVLEGLAAVFDDSHVLAGFAAVIFTGTGDVFASGADLRKIASVTAESAPEFALRGQAVMNQIAATPQLTVAAINGYCFGGALDLALACDRRIASPDAVFSHPGTGLGIITGWGGTQRLPRLIGEANALEMFFTAGRVDAPEALRIGLVDAVVREPYAHALAVVSAV
jgi:enoyl-CoA hydratase/carnithine racemase